MGSFVEGKPKGVVAGSVGPYGACLHDGSEYTGKCIDTLTDQVTIFLREKRNLLDINDYVAKIILDNLKNRL